jgi:hypothetical protein
MAIPSTPNPDFVWVRNNSMFETGCKFYFSVIFEELLDGAMWLTLPMGCGQGAKKQVCFTRKILDFDFF